MDDERLAVIAKAFAHPARVRILRLLAQQAECRGADVFSELPLAQSTVSEHLGVLKRGGLVRSHHVGTACVYCVDPEVIRAFASEIEALVASTPACSLTSEEC